MSNILQDRANGLIGLSFDCNSCGKKFVINEGDTVRPFISPATDYNLTCSHCGKEGHYAVVPTPQF